MAVRKKSSKVRKSKVAENSEDALSITDSLGKLGNECQSKFLEIASGYTQVSNLETTNLSRAIAEEQLAAQLASQEFWHNLSRAALQASAGSPSSQDIGKLNAEYAEQLESIRAECCNSLDKVHQQISQSVTEGTEAANDQWDAACAEFIGSVQEMVARVEPSELDPQDLYSLGQSLVWISEHCRTRKDSV